MDEAVPFQTVCFGDVSDQPPEGLLVARSADEWQESWALLERRHRPQSAVPPVDWENDMVIVFALGSRGSGGYAARIERLRMDGRRMRVVACEDRPGSSCVATQAVTNVYHVVTTRRHDLPIELVRRVEIRECE